MATTYAERKAKLNKIAADIVINTERLAEALAQATNAETSLNAMSGTYASLVSEINADAAASPGNQLLQLQKAEKDQIVADFMALKNRATAMKNAIAGVP